jgi:hypothetical protein
MAIHEQFDIPPPTEDEAEKLQVLAILHKAVRTMAEELHPRAERVSFGALFSDAPVLLEVEDGSTQPFWLRRSNTGPDEPITLCTGVFPDTFLRRQRDSQSVDVVDIKGSGEVVAKGHSDLTLSQRLFLARQAIDTLRLMGAEDAVATSIPAQPATDVIMPLPA